MKLTGEIKIEKGIPIPATRAAGMTATLRKMSVGDSIVVDKHISSFSGAFANCRKGKGCENYKFTARTEGIGTRIWRIA